MEQLHRKTYEALNQHSRGRNREKIKAKNTGDTYFSFQLSKKLKIFLDQKYICIFLDHVFLFSIRFFLRLGHVCSYVLCCAQSLSHVPLIVTPLIIACQSPLSMEILQARILEWVAMPSLGDLPNPGIKPRPLALQTNSSLSHQGSHFHQFVISLRNISELAC